MTKEKQHELFDLREVEVWRREWQDMPEYDNENLTPYNNVIVNFASRDDMDKFAELVGQRLTERTQSIWYPEAEIGRYANKRYISK